MKLEQRHQIWVAHFEYSKEGDFILDRTSTGKATVEALNLLERSWLLLFNVGSKLIYSYLMTKLVNQSEVRQPYWPEFVLTDFTSRDL